MVYQVSIKMSGASELAKKFRKFGASILDLSDALDDSANFLEAFFAGQVYASRGQVINEPWPALNPRYAARKARKWPGRPPLVRSGKMLRGYSHETKPLSVFLFNEQFYNRFHELGEGVPQRMTMKVDEARATKVVEFLENDIARKMERADV